MSETTTSMQEMEGAMRSPYGRRPSPVLDESDVAAPARSAQLGVAEAVDGVVVDHAHRLHQRVHRGRAHEPEAPSLEVLAQGLRQVGARREIRQPLPPVDDRAAVDEGPEVVGEVTVA